MLTLVGSMAAGGLSRQNCDFNGRTRARTRTRARVVCLVIFGLVACAEPPEAADPADAMRDLAHADGAVGAPASRAVAVTIDDLPVVATRADTVMQWAVTRGILAALDSVGAPAIGFVNEGKLGAGAARDARTRMLRAWLDAGHGLGNHTYSHPDINVMPLADYTADIVRGEDVTTQLLGERPRYFRHPFLHAGNDSAKKAGLEQFLAGRGYTVAPVTIDNGEWIFARAYDHSVDDGDSAQARRIGDAYVAYMDTVFGFYEAQARAIVGRDIPHVLLIHANRINADRLGDVLRMARRRGYRFVTLEDALRDDAYDRGDAYVGPAGITWLHRWAITDDMDRSIFRGEPEVPAWVESAARLSAGG